MQNIVWIDLKITQNNGKDLMFRGDLKSITTLTIRAGQKNSNDKHIAESLMRSYRSMMEDSKDHIIGFSTGL